MTVLAVVIFGKMAATSKPQNAKISVSKSMYSKFATLHFQWRSSLENKQGRAFIEKLGQAFRLYWCHYIHA